MGAVKLLQEDFGLRAIWYRTGDSERVIFLGWPAFAPHDRAKDPNLGQQEGGHLVVARRRPLAEQVNE